ncbi:MAG: dephospho-CoA kinase [Phycisphaerales bacterium]|nr:dephospho-CoA kinase [Phycisphaerales bacterium]
MTPVMGPAPGAGIGGETVLLSIRPSVWFVLIRSLTLIIVMGLIAALAAWGFSAARAAGGAWVVLGAAAIAVLKFMWEILEWASRSYLLTDRRIVRRAGVLRRDIADLPLRNIQHITIHRSLLERLLGVGTVGMATPGTAWTEVYFLHVDDPEGIMRKVRAAMDGRPRPAPAPATTPRPAHAPAHEGVIVIGLVGGIGAGKSEVARAMADLGAVIVDSDAEARAALERPEVKSKLVEWWGGGVLDAAGRADRAAIARIIFERPVERERLEGLVHPLVKSRRAELIARARAAGATIAVIDAPLLLEAGVDAECDRIVFVDAPREVRLRRVMETRGWSPQELDRREKAQWPLDRKRAAAHEVIVNDGDREALRRRIAEVVARARAAAAGPA